MQNGPTNVQTPAAAPPAATQNAPAQTGWLTKLRPSPWVLHKLLMLAVLLAVGAGAFFYGRRQHVDAKNVDLTKDPQPGDERYYSQRAVAYMYDKRITVTREELGEYLINRFGPDRVEFMLNRKIVEMECRKHGIGATDAEVEQRFQQDLKSFGTHLTQAEFVNSVLRRFGKTLFEWKEDVIRPKIMMEKLVRATVKISEKDVQDGFEARYGEKVECRMIVCEKGQANVAQRVWENARKGSAYFLEEARKPFILNLAASEGKVPPIHRHFGDKTIEDTAFRLKESEISPLLSMQDGTYVILMCEKKLPAVLSVKYDDEKQKLALEVTEQRIAQRIPEVFAEMRKGANPLVVLDNSGQAYSPVLAAPAPIAREPLVQQTPSPVVIPEAPKGPIVPDKGLPALPEAPKAAPMGGVTITAPTPAPAPVKPMVTPILPPSTLTPLVPPVVPPLPLKK